MPPSSDGLSRPRSTGELRVEPPARQRVADHVFETLVKAILRGEIMPGDPLPTQRELAKQFNISALVVRQAIHRLEDLGLVRVRQGSTTIVLDPGDSSDIRLIQLQMEMSDGGPAMAAAALENQALFVIPLLALAERRITKEELAVLNYLVDQAGATAPGSDWRRFRIDYWNYVAKATRNPMFQQQVRWWFTLMEDLDRRENDVPNTPQRVDIYKRLNGALASGQGTVAVWLEAMEPVLKWFDHQLAERDESEAAAPKS